MNARRAVRENGTKVAATKASASEHTQRTTAAVARIGTPTSPEAPRAPRVVGRTVTWSVAVAAAPIARKAPAVVKSCTRIRTNTAHDGPPGPSTSPGPARIGDPNRLHTRPTATAARSEATKRATTIMGWPGKATAVAARTTGLMAGAARRNATAAPGGTPDATSRPATTTELHSHPGRAAPASPATGTDRAARRGIIRASARPGTNAARAL